MLSINIFDPRPIYEQIKDSMKNLIFSGVIKPEEKIPSVRELAASLSINPNTIQRAYRELEAENIIYSVTGRGSFAADTEKIREKQKLDLLKTFSETVSVLIKMGETKEELIKIIEGGDESDSGKKSGKDL